MVSLEDELAVLDQRYGDLLKCAHQLDADSSSSESELEVSCNCLHLDALCDKALMLEVKWGEAGCSLRCQWLGSRGQPLHLLGISAVGAWPTSCISRLVHIIKIVAPWALQHDAPSAQEETIARAQYHTRMRTRTSTHTCTS